MPMMWFAKAIVAFLMPSITTAVLGWLGGVGVTGNMTVGTAITSAVTGLLVYLVPNAKKA